MLRNRENANQHPPSAVPQTRLTYKDDFSFKYFKAHLIALYKHDNRVFEPFVQKPHCCNIHTSVNMCMILNPSLSGAPPNTVFLLTS